MKIIKPVEWFNIIGRGWVVTASRKAHDFELTTLKDEIVLIDGEEYLVIGVEHFHLGSFVGDPVGLIVKKVEKT
jgi:hypothetical protein